MADEKDEIPDYSEGRSLEEIAEEEHYLVSDTGKYLQRMDLGLFIAPKYARCNTCPFAPRNGGECEEYVEDADCSIERTFFDLLVKSIAEHGIDDMDRLIIFPLAQQLFRLNRLYALELEINLADLYTFDEFGNNNTLDIYKEVTRMISDNEKGYMQKLKELVATRKERAINQGRTKRNKSEQTLSDLFANLDEKESV